MPRVLQKHHYCLNVLVQLLFIFSVRKVRCEKADWIYVAQDTVKWAAVVSILFLLRSQTFCRNLVIH